MARTVKHGLEYFPFDIDFFQDLRIRKLIKYQGGKAVTVYALLLCLIYKAGYYIRWDDELPFVVSEQTGYDEAYIQEVINCCVNIGLFSKELFKSEGVMTSRGIQIRYTNINKLCKRTASVCEYNLMDIQSTQPVKPKPKPTQKEPRKQELEIPTPPGPYGLTLEQEMEQLTNDDIWLDNLQVMHSLGKDLLRKKLEEFKVQCVTDGKERHQSLQDAKQHFNSWLRIVTSKDGKNDDNTQTNGRNRRRANILSADEKKEYGETF